DITLLYGENSSGKSSILQALQYAREVFCNGNLDCHRTEIGGDMVNLQGFANFRTNRRKGGEVMVGIEVAITDDAMSYVIDFRRIAMLIDRLASPDVDEPTVLPMHEEMARYLKAMAQESREDNIKGR